MVSVATIVGFLLLIVVHTFVAAVGIRFFRLRLATRLGAALYSLVFVPVVFLVSTLLLSGFIGFGGDGVADKGTALILTWVLPLMLGYSIDLFWMPSPDEVEVPQRARRDKTRRGGR